MSDTREPRAWEAMSQGLWSSASACVLLGLGGCATPTAASPTSSPAKIPGAVPFTCPAAPPRTEDGQHDFDFEIGAWKAHLQRLRHPLTGSNEWVSYDGTSVVRKVWDGRANLGELEVSGAAGAIEGMTLRLYDPKSHLWNVSFAGSGNGELTPPLVGGFHDGRGEFFDREELDGRPICARFVGSDLAAASFRLEQAFSADGGKTWEANWVSTFTRSAGEEARQGPGVAAPKPLTHEAIISLLASPDRTEADRKLDATRHPADLLTFFGVGAGMRVADLGAGFGYTTELLARAVGPTGTVHAQNDPDLFQKFLAKKWAARMASPANAVVVENDRPFDSPLPYEAKNLDLVVNYIFYHDTVWMGTDRDKMNRAVFAALKPGGAYVIVDASARSGHGVSDTRSMTGLHRIEQGVVETEVKKAGFTLAASGDFLRNASDTRDWDSSQGDRVGIEDRFVLRFVKP